MHLADIRIEPQPCVGLRCMRRQSSSMMSEESMSSNAMTIPNVLHNTIHLTVQARLSQTESESPKTGFLASRLSSVQKVSK